MKPETFKQRVKAIVDVDAFHAWEMEEAIAELAAQPEPVQEEIIRQIEAIWPVSFALCFAFLERVPSALTCLDPSQLGPWINAVLDAYERGGLAEARHFLADVETNFLCRIRGETGLAFDEAAARLETYARGLAGREIELATAPVASTDTETIFLPPEIAVCKDRHDNFLLYKLTVSHQWALLACRTFTPPADWQGSQESAESTGSWIQSFCRGFANRRLALDLFHLAETARTSAFLGRHLPGLARDTRPLREVLLRRRPDCGSLAGPTLAVEALKQWLLAGRSRGQVAAAVRQVVDQASLELGRLGAPDRTAADSAAATVRLYALIDALPDDYLATEPLLFQGILRPAAAESARKRRRDAGKDRFVKALAAILPPAAASQAGAIKEGGEEKGAAPSAPAEALAMLFAPTGADDAPAAERPAGPASRLTIGGEEIEIPETLAQLAREIRSDLGRVPDHYIESAVGLAGSGGPGPEAASAGDEEGATAGPLVYDEWDYRRTGYRKEWCTLLLKELQPVSGTFVDTTLDKYRGQLRQLRRQFEMMRLQQRFIKRQRDGDDIDLDALVESLADRRAGLAPSERLFIRLRRDERSIHAVFLVDMSSSTEGWVSTALKEALVLMCESLEVLGDPYAIYGFSGMRRLRSELFHIKHLDEPYNEATRGRIAAIAPKDYTRMGPPIRHVTEMLAASDAKVRLLITLSDGKPEDYDDYKGVYAIEDTRHALIEAKACGIHPFCITIDRQAHDYMPHMYGEVNYIFIDEVRKLPLRMPEIYRSLTT